MEIKSIHYKNDDKNSLLNEFILLFNNSKILSIIGPNSSGKTVLLKEIEKSVNNNKIFLKINKILDSKSFDSLFYLFDDEGNQILQSKSVKEKL